MSNSNAIKPFVILLVEDNPGDVRLTEEAFKEGALDTQLFNVSDGVEAINFLKKTAQYKDALRPDLILLDLNLPRKDGREVLQIIKNDDSLKRIPVVILTTSSAEIDIMKTYNMFANCYITKPVNMDEFIEVAKAIERFWLSVVQLPAE